jgi:[amino group carrier protein]-lysine/ornithine hydrolase
LQSYPVELLHSMLKTYSPSGSERNLAELLHKQLISRGFKSRKDSVGNVIGELGHEGPRILLCGHMDTVPGEIPVRIEGDLVYGRGAVDAKSTLAAMLVGSLLAKERCNLPFQITLAAVVEEERSSDGVKAIIATRVPYDLAVFGEPSGTSNIIVGYKGSLLLQVTCLTKGGHSASPWLSRNSCEEAFEFWKTLRESLLKNDSSSKFSAVTGCITSVTAGDGFNIIPSRTILELDIRIPPSIQPGYVAEAVIELAELYEKAHEGARILVAVKSQSEAFLGSEDSSAVRAFRWAIRRTIGRQVALVKKTGTSDMNLFAKSYSIPMIAYGPGDSSLDHTENEHVSINEYLSSIEIFANAIKQFVLLARDRAPLPKALQ